MKAKESLALAQANAIADLKRAGVQVLSDGHACSAARLGCASAARPSWLGMAPALLVLALITIAPAIYLVLTSLTPLNLTLPDTAWDFSTPAGNYLDLLEDPRFTRSVWVQVKLSVATVACSCWWGSASPCCSMAIRRSASWRARAS